MIKLSVVASVLLAVAACGGSDKPSTTPTSSSEPAASADIVDTAVAAGSFQTLVAAVEAAGLVDTLKGDGPFTVFAPTDEAFAKLPPGTVEALLADKEKLIAVLTYHVVAGKVTSDQVVGMTSAATVQGAELAKDAGFRVYTISLGTPEGTITRGFGGGFFGQSSPDQQIPVPPDPDTLRGIAEMTGGEFSEARTAESLEAVYERLGSSLGREPGETEITFALVALAAGLLLAAGLFSAAWSPRLP